MIVVAVSFLEYKHKQYDGSYHIQIIARITSKLAVRATFHATGCKTSGILGL